MIRSLPRLSLVLATVALAACTGNKPTPAGTSGEQKGQYGVSYFVSVSRPVGGTITSADGRIDCGTAGGTKNLCAPVSFLWGATATFTATPDAGQFFQSWAGDCSGAVASGGCSLDTLTYGADKWVVAVFNPPDQLGHSRIPDPSQHSPLFFDFIKSKATPNPGVPKCTSCHGANYDGVANAPSCGACHAQGSHAQAGHPTWLQDCDFCHGAPPATGGHADFVTGDQCITCHPNSVLSNTTINEASGAHMNGKVDGGCGGCHALPPATGAHLVHFGLDSMDMAGAAGTTGHGDLGTLQTRFPTSSPTGAPAKYAFGCGNCHPMDDSLHDNGVKDVVLARPGVTGSLKELNDPNAGYDATAKTCSGVYCHSSGQKVAPLYVATPHWFTGVSPGCAGCHSNPPRYVSGGAGTNTANSHFGVNRYGDPYGHVAGLPAPTLGVMRHGAWYGVGSASAMISCQTCHFDTTDPSNFGPGKFYYLDTTVDVSGASLGGNVGIFTCSDCHVDGSPTAPTGTGKVLPLRHVNGSRDVAFDPRTTLTSDYAYLLPAPETPTKPYWFTGSGGVAPEFDLTIVSFAGTTVQFDLTAARYNASTKTCSNVGCHLAQGSMNWNPGGADPSTLPLIPLVWGDPYWDTNSCAKCHATWVP